MNERIEEIVERINFFLHDHGSKYLIAHCSKFVMGHLRLTNEDDQYDLYGIGHWVLIKEGPAL